MKLAKKLLIITLLLSLFAPSAAVNNQKSASELTLVAEKGTTPVDYDNFDDTTIHPKSINIIIAI